MRTLTDHIVSADLPQSQLSITVTDEPGQGGANHAYAISWPGSVEGGPNVECLISFQNGPIKEFGMNGITQEALLAVVIDRLRGFQSGQFACQDNEEALKAAQDCLWWLQKRTRDRLERGVEGKNEQ